jgi:hypothetical protein
MRTCVCCFLLLTTLSLGRGQDRVYISFNPGYSFYDAENHTKITGGKTIGWTPGLSVGYQTERLIGEPLRFEYDFTYSRLSDVLTFVVTGSAGPSPVGYISASLTYAMHDLDLSLVIPFAEWAGASIGPSCALLRRTIDIPQIPNDQGRTLSLEDRLVSYSVGINVSLYLTLPGTPEPQTVFAFFGTKLRYLHSIYFDARGRALDNYYQDSLLGQIQVGLGYYL